MSASPAHNVASMLARTARAWPRLPAIAHGPRVVADYATLAARAARQAAAFGAARLVPGDRVALVSHNVPAYIETRWFERGFVTYTNESKADMLGVRSNTIERFGAVSMETAAEMATGALGNSKAMISLAITGIAGPTGGSPGKPVGTVCFGWCLRGQAPETGICRFEGDREAIRRQSVIHALEGLLSRAKSMP